MKISISQITSRFIRIPILLLVFLCISHVQIVSAVEPDRNLFHDDEDVRHRAYNEIGQHIAEKLTRSNDEKEMQHLLIQQQLLRELKELPDRMEKVSLDNGFREIKTSENFSWEDFRKFLQMYIYIIKEEQLSAENLKETEKQKKTLNSKLLALPESSSEKTMLQLQHAYQIRKLNHQSEVDQQLKKRLIGARDKYAEILDQVNITEKEVEIQTERFNQVKQAFENLAEQKKLASTSDETRIEQQESLLASYLGKELGSNDKKTMHYEQLKLLELRTGQLTRESQVFKAQLDSFAEEQTLLWFNMLSKKEGYFHIADLSGDITKNISLLRKRCAKAQVRKYTYEKELAFLRGGNAMLGPKSLQLIEELDGQLSEIFTLLSGLYKRAEVLEIKGRLLNEAIDQKQPSLGSMVTKTREATDTIYEKTIKILKYPLISYSGMTLTMLVVLQIMLLLIFGIIINRLYGHVVVRMGRKRKWTERTIQLVHAMGKYPFIFIVAMILLSVIGINTSSLALVAGALSVGIGFGMQTIVNNLVSGIILLFDKSIRPGDFISLGDHTGRGGYRGNVVQMNTRSTVLRTNDNINIIIPNADLMASQVVNWTYSDEKIRFRVPFSAAYGSDIDMVKDVVKQAVLKLSVVLSQPEPQIWMAEHAESSLNFLAAIWVEGQSARRPAYTFDIVLTAIYKTLEKHKIEIPFPQMDLRLRDGNNNLKNGQFTDTSIFSAMRN